MSCNERTVDLDFIRVERNGELIILGFVSCPFILVTLLLILGPIDTRIITILAMTINPFAWIYYWAIFNMIKKLSYLKHCLKHPEDYDFEKVHPYEPD